MCAFSQWSIVFFVNLVAKIHTEQQYQHQPQRKCRRHGYSVYLPSFVRFQQHLRGSDVRKLQQIQVKNTRRSDADAANWNYFVVHSLSGQMLVERNKFGIFAGRIVHVATEMRQIRLQWWFIFRFVWVRINCLIDIAPHTTRKITFILIENRCGKVNAATGYHLEGDLSKDYPDCCPKAVPNWYECISRELNKSNSP